MAGIRADQEKARIIFDSVFRDLDEEWVGPEHDFDRDSYKARIQTGKRKGQILYISSENLQDSNITAEDIKLKLLQSLK